MGHVEIFLFYINVNVYNIYLCVYTIFIYLNKINGPKLFNKERKTLHMKLAQYEN